MREKNTISASSGTANPPNSAAAQQAAGGYLLDDHTTAEAFYDLVRVTAGGLALIFAAFILYQLIGREAPRAGVVLALDQVVLVTSVALYWSMRRRKIPATWAQPLIVTLGLLVAANVSATVLARGEGSDLRYLQAIVVGGGAIALSSRALAVLLLGTAAMAMPVATVVCPMDEVFDFGVMQLSTSLFSVALCYGRINNQRMLLLLRQRTQRTAEDLAQALTRAEREYAELQRSEQKRRELEEQLRQAQKLEALGTLAGGVAHDMNNVLGAISAIASDALGSVAPGSLSHQELTEILTAARRGATLTRNILSFAGRVPANAAPFRVEAVLAEVQVLLKRALPKRIVLSVAADQDEHWVEGDGGQIGHLIMNLCLNSADAIDRFGHVDVATRSIQLDEEQARKYAVPPGAYVELTVTDDGHGIPAELMPRLFDPYFSTKAAQGHSGLGLSMVYGTVQEHRGGISIRSVVGRGTTVSVVLPRRDQPPSVPEALQRVPRVDATRNVLLFVDDEPLLCRAGRRIAESLGFEALTASDGQEALDLFSLHRARIGAVVLDIAMPVMSGDECFYALRRLDPELPIVLASGFTGEKDVQALVAATQTPYLRKPYDKTELAEALSEVLGAAEEPRADG